MQSSQSGTSLAEPAWGRISVGQRTGFPRPASDVSRADRHGLGGLAYFGEVQTGLSETLVVRRTTNTSLINTERKTPSFCHQNLLFIAIKFPLNLKIQENRQTDLTLRIWTALKPNLCAGMCISEPVNMDTCRGVSHTTATRNQQNVK